MYIKILILLFSFFRHLVGSWVGQPENVAIVLQIIYEKFCFCDVLCSFDTNFYSDMKLIVGENDILFDITTLYLINIY